MDKNAVFTHYSQILDSMLSDCMFFQAYFQYPTQLGGLKYFHDVKLVTGATRGCLVDDNYPYVVKFDLEGDELYDSGCARELLIYREAQKEGLDSYLCEVDYIGTYYKTIYFYDSVNVQTTLSYGYECSPEEFEQEFLEKLDEFGAPCSIEIEIPLYAYRRADHFYFNGSTNDEKKEALKHKSPLCESNTDVAVEFIRSYGMDEFVRFSAFLNEFLVNDVHLSNTGYVDACFCLIDYAGYHDFDYVVEYNGEEIL